MQATMPGMIGRAASAALLALVLLTGCSVEESYGDPWTNPRQQERLGSEGERDPEASKALRERARYNQADR